jgi:transcriptional regulator with XRE-family HTH domain
MTPAEVKVLRESLGLSAQWLADAVGADQRTVRRWEDGAIPLRDDLIALLHELEAQAQADAETILDAILADQGVDEVDDLDDLLDAMDEGDWPTLEVPRVDADALKRPAPYGVLPASYWRAVAARVRWELGGRCWIEYGGS